QHNLVSGLDGAGVVGSERVLGRQSPMRPKSKVVTILERIDLCNQLIPQRCGWFCGEHGLPWSMNRTVPSSSIVWYHRARFDGRFARGRGFSHEVGSIEIILTGNPDQRKQCVAPGV